MIERLIEINRSLWLDTKGVRADGLFALCDESGGRTFIDKEDIPALVKALSQLLKDVQAQEQELKLS